jgi:hypothetical protein
VRLIVLELEKHAPLQNRNYHTLYHQITYLGPKQTEQVKTELTNKIARNVKTDLSRLVETI